jgi:hypothetical protein
MAYSELQKEQASKVIKTACSTQLDISKLLGVSEAQVLLLKKGN